MSHLAPKTPDARASLRWVVYTLLIVVAASTMVGRILAVRSDLGGTPFLSANDRSRWCTISALVDFGTGRTAAAGAGTNPLLAVERLGEDSRDGGLADPAGAAEQVRVMQAVAVQRVDQGLHHVFLTHHLLEVGRAPLAR